MKNKHRDILRELMDLCNQLGGVLDGTSTNEAKYRDRQRGLMDAYRVLYAVLADHPENHNSEADWADAHKSIENLKLLKNKVYPDRKGLY